MSEKKKVDTKVENVKSSKKEEKNKSLQKQIDELKDQNIRLQAEFENYRKRKEIEMNEMKDRTISNFIQDILPALDNFEMSLKMTDNQDMFIKGVEMIHKNLTDTLKEHKIESFEPKLNEKFNPTEHDPIPVEDENSKAGIVLNTLSKGYKHKGKIIRTARVHIKKEN